MTSTSGAEPAIGRRGLLLILSSPSGAGKSTLTRNLVREDRGIRLSVSVTTRAEAPVRDRRRALQLHRRATSSSEMRDRGDLLEWAEVHGNFYGTPRKPVEQALAARRGHDVRHRLAGHAADASRRCADDVVSVFILPPCMAELKARLERRAEDPPEIDRAPPAQRARRDRPVGRTTTTCSSTTISTAPSATSRRSSRPSACKRERASACRISSRPAGERSTRMITSDRDAGSSRRDRRDGLRFRSAAVGASAARFAVRQAFASATKPATGTSSARTVSARPAVGDDAAPDRARSISGSGAASCGAGRRRRG